MSFFDVVDPALKARVLDLAANDPGAQRACGCMLGMAIADSIGHNFEFLPARDEVDVCGPYFEFPSSEPGGTVHQALNQFQLKPGQWTDDTSMALCIADSLLYRASYDGAHIRVLFYNWWFNGLNNAFRLDKDRQNVFSGGSLSVGLGGNIAKSLTDVDRVMGGWPSARFESTGVDAGNGSLMRLAPVPIFYRYDAKTAREMAFESSLTTHPGPLAAEACALYAHLIVRALERRGDDSAAEFIDKTVAEYAALQEDPTPAQSEILRLLRSAEPDGSKERCWSWRSKRIGIEKTLHARGSSYNGYPVSAGYFGAFSLDGLAIALHCVYHTCTFNECVTKVDFCSLLREILNESLGCQPPRGCGYNRRHRCTACWCILRCECHRPDMDTQPPSVG
jgi:ADP-ribosylglycohydrolase